MGWGGCDGIKGGSPVCASCDVCITSPWQRLVTCYTQGHVILPMGVQSSTLSVPLSSFSLSLSLSEELETNRLCSFS